MGYLYIITGASGCGKTTLINSIAVATRESTDPSLADRVADAVVDPDIRAVRAPKYSERPLRAKSDEVDDVIHLDEISLDTCDVAYVINSTKYGLRFRPIEQLLDHGYNCFVAVSDLRVVGALKAHFPNRAKAVYLSSAIDPQKLEDIQRQRRGEFDPDEEAKALLSRHFAKVSAGARLGWWDRVSECMSGLERDWRRYSTGDESTKIRQQRIRETHIRYIDHIGLFDHAILNYAEGDPGEMFGQMRNLIAADSSHLARGKPTAAPVFIVAAASGTGKGTLMEMLHLIGRDSIRIVSKLAKRKPKPNDRRDGMIALLRGESEPEPEWPGWWTPEMVRQAAAGKFPDEYDLRWSFHGATTEYAISSQEVNRNIEEGTPQIFVSNMGQFSRFRTMWPDDVVFLYLHRLSSKEEDRQFQMKNCADLIEAETRIAEKAEVHREFIRHIAEFQHVLLNTSYQEDLYDQMFHLIAHYQDSARNTPLMQNVRKRQPQKTGRKHVA